jgi:hypothetical protein
LWLATSQAGDLAGAVKLLSLPKPLLFLLFGSLGALLGWGIGEVFATKARAPEAVALVEEVSPGVFRRNTAAAAAAPSLLFDSAVQGRLVAAGASMSGDIMAALSWETMDDLDLHCVDPAGNRIYFKHRRSSTGGELDVDQNVSPPYRIDPVEHIYWPLDQAPEGKYLFYVHFFTRRSELADVPFKLEVQIGDKIVTRTGTLSSAGGTKANGRDVLTFDYQRAPAAPRTIGAMGFLLGVASVGLTLGFLALGTSYAVSVAQERILGADSWVPRNLGKIVLLSLCAGILAGFIGQGLLTAMASHFGAAGGKLFKVVAWVVVGGTLGFAFSLIIPNLDRGKAVLGGLIGGVLAGLALSFVLAREPSVGRFVACIILGGAVGLSVAVVEAMAREGYLRVIWGPGEFTTVNLGETPVTVGTGAESTIRIPKSSGFPPTIATFVMHGGQASMYHNMTGATHPLRDGNKLPLGTVTIEVKLFS